MGYIHLKGGDIGRITDALGSAYAGVLDVHALLALIANTVPEIARGLPVGGSVDAIVFKAVDLANRHGVLDKLLIAAANDRPRRPDLRELVLVLSQRRGWTAGAGAHDLSRDALERLTSGGSPFLDPSRLARWMIGVESHVCQVFVDREAGTGFLVAADLVLTNHHVVKPYLDSASRPELKVRFDYRVSPAGAEPSSDLPWITIDADWDIPWSPHSEADITLVGDPATDELDYALLKLGRKVGLESLPNGAVRGWVDVSSDVDLPQADDPILIVQHPGQPPMGSLPQQPLRIAFATPGFEQVNANGTRVAYRPSTLPGSSGSPVFGPDYRCVALHHNRGQISAEAAHMTTNNRGIPISAIRAHLDDGARALLVPPPAG